MYDINDATFFVHFEPTVSGVRNNVQYSFYTCNSFCDILLHPTNTNNIHQEGFVVIAFIRTKSILYIELLYFLLCKKISIDP